MASSVQTDDHGPSRERLVAMAIEEFGEKGFEGARVNEIAARAHINKQLVYHYFKSKDGLYRAALEAAYLRFRGDDQALRAQVEGVDAPTALRQLCAYLFRPSQFSIYFQRMIQDENRREASALRDLPDIKKSYQGLLRLIEEVLARGAAAGEFRADVDVKQFYISMVGLFSTRICNAATLSVALDVDLTSEAGFQYSFDQACDLLVNSISRR